LRRLQLQVTPIQAVCTAKLAQLQVTPIQAVCTAKLAGEASGFPAAYAANLGLLLARVLHLALKDGGLAGASKSGGAHTLRKKLTTRGAI